jgi:putative membrane-bound dehydrogenase-like protein
MFSQETAAHGLGLRHDRIDIHFRRWGTFQAILVALPLLIGASPPAGAGQLPATIAPTPSDGPLTPELAARSFQLEPGLRVELVAAEPMVQSPVALAFDDRGRMYVAENRGYPTGPGAGKPPAGRIALLEDTDGDGRMDRRTEFAQGLTYPNGVMPWRRGLIVTCAPDVLYLRDTDGDGASDQRRVLFTGFSTTGSTQLRVSHPTLSIDNWIYLTSGLSGGKVVSPAAPGRPAVELGRTDFRFRPDSETGEAADGGSQFGLSFDDFGRRFICYNRVQVQHVVISSKTLRRNPSLAFSETVENCPAELVPEPLKGHGAAARLFPISRNITTADSHAGTFTAACAVTVFRGTGLPAPYRGGVFSCDPTGNLVHFDRLEPRGATFTARRVRAGTEVLASRDNWFRPVFLAHGPDGALYVCDMYRKTIEHPDYLPVEIRKHTDFDSGKTMGRIWRLVRDDARPDELRRLRQVNLASRGPAQLCEILRNPDGWWRDTAHRLLLERRDPATVAPLRSIVVDSRARPASVVHALRLLDALDALPDALVRQTLRHPAAPVREHALQLVKARLARASQWLTDVLPSVADHDARVRFQAAITLGAAGGPPDAKATNRRHRPGTTVSDADVVAALARMAARDGSDRWARAAVFSSLAGREQAFLTTLQALPRNTELLSLNLLDELGRLLGASRPRDFWPGIVRRVIAEKSGFAPLEQAAFLTGLLEAARSRLATQASGDVLSPLVQEAGDRTELKTRATELIAAMKQIAASGAGPLEGRCIAVGLLAFAGFDRVGDDLLRLVDSQQPGRLQAAAVRALAAQRDARVATSLLAPRRFATYAPLLREEVLAALLARSDHLSGLLTALENGSIPAGALAAEARLQLTQSRDADVRRRAGALFGTVTGDRAKVFEAYKDVVTWKAYPANGRLVFRRVCASCHRLDQEGYAVGPDLFGIRNQPKPAILLHLLVPDHEITPGFAAYTVATTDGRVLTGLITSETPTTLTLRQPLGKEETILRADIEEISAGKQSLMPQGLEQTVTRQEFADLLAYLKGEGVSSSETAP